MVKNIKKNKVKSKQRSRSKPLKSNKMTLNNIKSYLPKTGRLHSLYDSLPLYKKERFFSIYQIGYVESLIFDEKQARKRFFMLWFLATLICYIILSNLYDNYEYTVTISAHSMLQFLILDQENRVSVLIFVSFVLGLCGSIGNHIFHKINFMKRNAQIDAVNYELASKSYDRVMNNTVSTALGNQVSIDHDMFHKQDLLDTGKSMSLLKEKFSALKASLVNLDDEDLDSDKNKK